MYIVVNHSLPKEYDNVLEDICDALNNRDDMFVTVVVSESNHADFSGIDLSKVAGMVVRGSATIIDNTIVYKIKMLEGTPHGAKLKQVLQETTINFSDLHTKVKFAALGTRDETGMIDKDSYTFLHPYFSYGEKTNFMPVYNDEDQ